MTETRCHGTVSDYDPARGYGRIVDDNERAFYVHYRDLVDAEKLEPGERVHFQPQVQRKGNIAREVRKA